MTRHLLVVCVLLSSSLAMAQSAGISNVYVNYDPLIQTTGVASISGDGQLVYVGMTLRKPDGTEYDLAAQAVTPTSGGVVVTLTAMLVGSGYTEYVISVWSRKVTPCHSDRPGCKKFGYVLDGQLASTGWTRM